MWIVAGAMLALQLATLRLNAVSKSMRRLKRCSQQMNGRMLFLLRFMNKRMESAMGRGLELGLVMLGGYRYVGEWQDKSGAKKMAGRETSQNVVIDNITKGGHRERG